MEEKPAPRTSLVLRLDDGSVIGDASRLLGNNTTGPVLLDAQHLFNLGRLGQKDVDRLQGLLTAFEAKVPNINALRPALKTANPYSHEGQRALKRQRSSFGGHTNGDLQFASPDGGPPDFHMRCREVLEKVYHEIGPKEDCYGVAAKDVFYKPVEETFPAAADLYYSKIARPMTLRAIEDRLIQRSYAVPQEFCDDMRLVWANCRQYNPAPTDPIHRLGARLERHFEEAWAATGMALDERTKRTTAGVAAARFEPTLYEQPPPSRTKSGAGGGNKVPRNGRHEDGLGRHTSHEVSSYVDRSVPEDLLQSVAENIQLLNEDLQQGALALCNEGVVTTTADGEVELDFEKMTYDALMQVDAFIRQNTGQPPRSPEPAAAGAVQMDQSDFEEEEESDSDSD